MLLRLGTHEAQLVTSIVFSEARSLYSSEDKPKTHHTALVFQSSVTVFAGGGRVGAGGKGARKKQHRSHDDVLRGPKHSLFFSLQRKISAPL